MLKNLLSNDWRIDLIGRKHIVCFLFVFGSLLSSSLVYGQTEVATIAALRALENGTEAKLTGEAVLLLASVDRNQKWIADETGGIVIDDSNGAITTAYSVGDGITGITGAISVYNELVQFVPSADPGAATSSGNEVTPVAVTLAEFASGAYQGMLVKIEAAEFAAADGEMVFGTASSNGDLGYGNYTLTDGTDSIVFRAEYTDADYIDAIVPQGTVDVTGVASQYATTAQLIARTADDIEIYEASIEFMITEVWSGNTNGGDITEDWFEIINLGSATWVASEDGALYYDDESSDIADATIIEGLSELAPGERALVVVAGEDAVAEFAAAWDESFDFENIQIGYTDGSGLSADGEDGVTLWLGDPKVEEVLVAYAGTPATAGFPGASYDFELEEFSEPGNGSGARTSDELNDEGEATIASPGDMPIKDVEGEEEEEEGSSWFVYGISQDEDLSEENLLDNSIDFSSSDLEFGSETDASTDLQRVGIRFRDILLPSNAQIISAHIQFEVDEVGKNADPCDLTIYVEDAANAAEFSNTTGDLSSRTVSSSTVNWSIEAGTWASVDEADADQMSADISDLIQEIIAKEDWESGNAIAFYIEGTGRRVAKSLSTGNPPYLVVEAVIPPALPTAVSVLEDFTTKAGWNFSIDVKSAFYDIDSELVFDASGLNGEDLPEGVMIENGVIYGTISKPGYYPITVTAIEADTYTRAVSQVMAIIAEPEMNRMLKPISTVKLGTYEEGAAEISAYDPTSKRLFVTNAEKKTLDIVDMSNPAALSVIKSLDITTYGGGLNSVAVANGKVAVAIEANTKQDNGQVVVFDSEGNELWKVTVGALPDMVTFTKDGAKILVANEGEPSADYTVDPEGSVSIIDVATESVEFAVNFNEWDAKKDELIADGARIFGPNATVSQDLEPEYITTIGDTAYVALQENNALAIIQISTGELKHIKGLGYKDHSLAGNGLDVPDADFAYESQTLLHYETFDENIDGYASFSVVGDEVYEYNQYFDGNAMISGFNGGAVANEDWLVSPYIDLTGFADPSLHFHHVINYLNVDPTIILSVKVASDFDGDVEAANWTTVEVDRWPVGNSWSEEVWAEISLKEFAGEEVVIAFVYDNTDLSDAPTWEIGEIAVTASTPDMPEPENKGIYISNWPVKGIYMPDAIASYASNGKKYILSANEGDSRDYDGYSEEASLEDVKLDPASFDDIADFEAFMGGIDITTALADTTEDGAYKTIYTYGARSFSVWDENGDLVFDSGEEFEQIIAALYPKYLNASNTNLKFKNRSDNKGPEPEAITIGEVDGRTYAFIGLERMGGIMVYDITDPTAPQFVEYFNNRDFESGDEESGDSGPEGILFIPAADNAYGTPLIVVSNEISGTVTTYSIGEAQNPFTLAIFHNNDGESALLADSVVYENEWIGAGSIGQFVSTLDSLRDQAATRGYESIMLSSGDNFLAGQTFNASKANGVYYDAMALNRIDYDAICLGNHDFDFGTSVLADFINAYEINKAPYLTSNLGFDNVDDLKALVAEGRIAPSTVIERGNEKIGVIGLTTPEITTISSPGNTEVSEAIADSVQKQVDKLIADGINKIILISHLQGLEEDKALIPNISGVDIVIAGGGDELLSNDPSLGDPYGIATVDTYPMLLTDKDDKDVYLVTTPGNYRYLGNLLIEFDTEGNVAKIYDSNPVLVHGKADEEVVEAIEEPIRDYIGDLVNNIIAISEVDLDFRKPTLRTQETNAGNLFADAVLWQAQKTHAEFGVAKPQVAIQNGGGLRIEKIIEAGEFNENYTYEIAAFTNIVSVVEEISAEKFKELMEWGLAEAPVSNGRFPQIAGFEVVYDQGLEAGSRVLSITLEDGTKLVENGAVVEGAEAIALATIDFTANGGDGYPFDGLTYTTLGATYQQAFLNYLVAEDGLDSVITAEQYPWEMNERILVEQSPLPAVASIMETFDSVCDGLPEGWNGFYEENDLMSCDGVENTFLYFNGYGVGEGASYLISPRVNVSAASVLSFDYTSKYDGPAPEVYYSVDYIGYGDPDAADWFEIGAASDTIAMSTGGAFAHVDGIHFDTVDVAISIAFVYTSEGASSGQSLGFSLDNVIVTEPSTDTLVSITENFGEIPAGWTEFNDGNDLITEGDYIDFNGYGVGAGISWLVTPLVEFEEGASYEMSFDHVKRFSGPDVQVVYSNDYPGYGDPGFYQWDTLAIASDSANAETASNDFVNTGSLDISEIKGAARIAFLYEATSDISGGSLRFRVDSLVVRASNYHTTLVKEMEDMTQVEGFGSFTVDLSDYFSDKDDTDLIYVVSSSKEEFATVSVASGVLTVTEVGVGATTIFVSATDEQSSVVSTEFMLTIEAKPLSIAPSVRELTIYPNPAAEVVTLRHDAMSIAQVRIYGLNGQLVLSSKVAEGGRVDVSDLKSGIYLIEISDEEGANTLSSKLIKQ